MCNGSGYQDRGVCACAQLKTFLNGKLVHVFEHMSTMQNLVVMF